MRETWVQSLGREDPLEKEMATHSSILAWRIPWTEEPGGLRSTGLQRVGHNWATSLTHSLNVSLLNIYFDYYLFGRAWCYLQHSGSSVLIVACGIFSCINLIVACGIWFLDQGSWPLFWEHRVPAIGLLRKSLNETSLEQCAEWSFSYVVCSILH